MLPLGVLLKLLVGDKPAIVRRNILKVEPVLTADLRRYHRIAIAGAQGHAGANVKRMAVVAAVVVRLGAGVYQRAVGGGCRVFTQTVYLVGDRGVDRGRHGGQGGNFHIGIRREDVGRVGWCFRFVSDDGPAAGEIVVLRRHVVVVVGGQAELVAFGLANRLVVVGHPEVAAVATLAVVHVVVPVAPHVGKFLGLRAVRAFRAPGVLDEPGAVAGRGVLSGDVLGKAGGEVFLRVGVVPAYDGNCMVGGKGAGRVLRPIRAEVFSVVVKVGGNRAIRMERDGHPAAIVGLVGGVCVQLVLHDVDGRPVDAGIAAVLVEVAGLGQDVAVLKDVVRRVPPGKIVGIRAGLRIYGPVGIDGVALGVGEVA